MSSKSDLESTSCKYEVEIKSNITTIKIPETYTDEPLTEEEKIMLSELEEEFACRYTSEDEEYIATVNQKDALPPLIEDYRPNRRRDFRRDDRVGGTKRSWYDQRSYGDNRYAHDKHLKYDNRR